MRRSKKTAAHYRARMMGLAVAMEAAASLGTAGARELYPSPGERYRNDRTSIHKLRPRTGTAPVSIALERAPAKAWAPVPCTPKVQAT